MEFAFTKYQYPATPSTSMVAAKNTKRITAQSLPAEFNPKDKQHKDLLHSWCQETWPSTFRKSLQSGNMMHYHGCCTCFSRRAFCKLAGHPELQTCKLSKMPSFKDVSSALDLYHWLLGLLTEDSKRGVKVYFPAINRLHFNPEQSEQEEDDEEMHSLQKRVERLTQQETKLTEQVKQLKSENEKLVLSMKMWYMKYQELLDKTEPNQPSVFTTPVTKRTKHNFESFDELF